MAIPPRVDPRRPLHLAVASCRLLGVLGLLATTCMGVSLFMLLARVRLGPGGRGPNLVLAFGPFALFAAIGVAYLVFAHFIKRRQFWAVVAALVLTGLVSLLALLSTVASVIAIVASGATASRPAWMTLGVQALVLAALGQLIYHLARSFAALKLAPPDEARGFDVLPVAVVPTDVAGSEGGDERP
jgi:hypothetical protein